MASFCDKFQELIEAQQNQCVKAVYQSGDYVLSPLVAPFHVNQLKWHQMTSTQRVAQIQKVLFAFERTVSGKASSDGVPGCSSHSSVEQHVMSVNVHDVTLSAVSEETLSGIWAKAERLLSTEGSVIRSPGSATAYIVANENLKKPHFVQLYKTGKIACDEQYPMWRGQRICSHSVAVAEQAQCLPKFLSWLQKSKQESNITKLLMSSSKKKSAGTKSGRPSRRHSSVKQKGSISVYRSRIEDVCQNDTSMEPSCLGNSDTDLPAGSCYINVSANHGSNINWASSYSSPSFNSSYEVPWYGYDSRFHYQAPPSLPWLYSLPTSSPPVNGTPNQWLYSLPTSSPPVNGSASSSPVNGSASTSSPPVNGDK